MLGHGMGVGGRFLDMRRLSSRLWDWERKGSDAAGVRDTKPVEGDNDQLTGHDLKMYRSVAARVN